MIKFIIIFALVNFANVILNTIKSLITIKGGKWLSAIANALTYGFYTFVIVLTANDGLSTMWKAIIVCLCNFIGVLIVKWVEQLSTKDKLWCFTATAKENGKTIEKIHSLFKSANISCVYNEVEKDKLYSLQVFSKSQKESDVITSIFANYNIKYCAFESKA